ncbi:Isochorismatase-like protein [Boletus reticuloceps]|uniref:nicotinamidase n=1 Tax=Boletus reticuloceps TaxID=495285 RepID=A0A8I2Z183_9AGAM|nr:Isochorismatase-like protein [Boletus reticuloceps]
MAETRTPVNALLVIDMQVDFITGSLAVPDGPSVIDPVKEIIQLPFHARYASKDWHPPGHISFASTHPGKALFGLTTIHPPQRLAIANGQNVQWIAEHGLEQVLWPDHCIQARLAHSSSTLCKRIRTDPGVESYSAFQDPWGLLISNLEGLLREKGVTDLYIVGVAGDHCVKESAIDAVKACAWKTWVVREGVRSVSTEGKEWDTLKSAGVGIIDTISDLKTRLCV